ncbi:MAG: branched-chain amino acid ABC transporter permease [Anaerolineae bacterium]|nr:branched-chain amino acid ABC transporter permease [Anaerolineae bacterium]
MELFLQQVINGLTIGAFYAVVALGYTMVYGVLKLINFAHGDMFMWGTLIGFWALDALLGLLAGLDLVAILMAAVLSMGLIALIGMGIERIAYRPLRTAGRLSPVISALGAAFVLESVARNATGASYEVYPQTSLNSLPSLRLGSSLQISGLQIIVFVISVLLMVALYLFVQRTRLGTAMRAVSINHDVSRLMGINVDRIITLVFLIGPALGAAAGMMVGIYYGSFDFSLGWVFGLKAFIAAILGGIGNIPGAVLGGFLLGLVEALGAGYISASWKDAIAYALLIIILIVRPTGILGETQAEKV